MRETEQIPMTSEHFRPIRDNVVLKANTVQQIAIDGFASLASVETHSSGLLLPMTDTDPARQTVISVGPRVRHLRPGMVALINLDVPPIGILDDGAKVYPEGALLAEIRIVAAH